MNEISVFGISFLRSLRILLNPFSTGIFFFLACLCSGWGENLSGMVKTNGVSDKNESLYTSFIIDRWQTEDGLPQNSVISIMQDKPGYLWLGTLNGLVKFDGLRFQIFDENNTRELTDSRIVYLFEDSDGNFWIGTEESGVFLVKGDRILNLDIGRGSRSGRLMSACEDSSKAVWLYTANGQLCRYREGRGDIWNFEADGAGILRLAIPDDDGGIIVATDRRVSKVAPTKGLPPTELPVVDSRQYRRVDYVLKSRNGGFWLFADGRIRKIAKNAIVSDLGEYPWTMGIQITSGVEDREGNLVVGTLGAGVFIINSETRNNVNLTTSAGLSHNYVLSMCLDREGTLWVGTDGGGLNRIKRSYFRVVKETAGLTAQSIHGDRYGNMWFGFNSLDPLSCVVARYSTNGNFAIYNFAHGLLNSSVRSIFCDNENTVWVGTWAGLYKLSGARFQPVANQEALSGVIQAIYQDKSGVLYFGTRNGLVKHDKKSWQTISTKDGLSANNIQAIASDSKSNLWIGTFRGGINMISDKNVVVFNRTNSALASDNVNSLYIDSDDTVFAGTGSGLAIFKGNKWSVLSSDHGLPCNYISFIVEDLAGSLWCGSSAGLIRISKNEIFDFINGKKRTVYCRNYGKADGLPTAEFTFGSQPGACCDSKGNLWLPSIKGVIFINPSELKPNLHIPDVVIEGVLIDGEPCFTNSIRSRLPEKIIVNPHRRRVEIYFASLNLRAPEKAGFRYKLEGLDGDWTDGGNARSVRYNNLPPGKYRFVVTARNEDGIWNETGASIAIVVEPPFYRTARFIILCSLFIIGVIATVVHRISTRKLQRQLEAMRQKEALEKERSRIARDLHDQLGASLTQIALLGELAEADKDLPHEVESHARQITQTARETTRVLDEIVWAVNPSNDTLESLANYICKYAQEYLSSANIGFRNEIPSSLPDLQIPPEVRHNLFLAVKESITNIVRHSKATLATLRLEIDRNRLTIEIKDNGIGIGELNEIKSKNRSGLSNMEKRVRDIGGEFLINKGSEGGTVIKMVIPVNYHNNRESS